MTTITRTYDPQLWQLVPKTTTFEMDRELTWGADDPQGKWTEALAAAPQPPEEFCQRYIKAGSRHRVCDNRLSDVIGAFYCSQCGKKIREAK